jgi:hypothetical protein
MPIVDPFAPDSADVSGKGGFVDPFDVRKKSEKVDEAPLSWGDVPGQALRNVPKSAGEFVSGIGHAIFHPIETVGNLGAVGAGVLQKLGVAPGSGYEKYADAIGKHFMDRYGNEENIKRALANDPVGVAADLSAVFTGGETLAAKLVPELSRVTGLADTLGTAAKYTNPLTPVVAGGRGLADLARKYTPDLRPRVDPGVQQSLQTLEEAGAPVRYPVAYGSENERVQSLGQGLSHSPLIGTPIRTAGGRVPAELSEAANVIAGEHGEGSIENVGKDVIDTVRSAARDERTAAEGAAADADAAIQGQYEAANRQREQAIDAREQALHDDAEGQLGNVLPRQAGQTAIDRVQNAHREARAEKDRQYGQVRALDARIDTGAFSDLHGRAARELTDANVTFDDPGSNASRMMDELQRLSGRAGEAPPQVPPRLMQALQREYGGEVPSSVLEGLGFPGGTDAVPPNFRLAGAHAPQPGANAISVQGLEEISRRLGGMAAQAPNPTEARASWAVKRAFENWRNDALESHLTADSAPGSRETIAAARAAHADLMNRFGYNGRTDVGRFVHDMVTGDKRAEDVAGRLLGNEKGISEPLHQAILDAANGHPDINNSLRAAAWNQISGRDPLSGHTVRSAEQIARAADKFGNTRMAERLGMNEGLRGLSQNLRQTVEDRAALPDIEKVTKPSKTTVAPGEMEQLSKKLTGLGRSPEAVMGSIDRLARTKGGDINTLAKLWRTIPEESRGDVASALIKNLGGGGKEGFSVAKFATNWAGYTPQAKTVMFGNAGPHRAALDAIADLSRRAELVGKKYGNPTGTANIRAYHDLFKGAVKMLAKSAAREVGPAAAAVAGGLTGPLAPIALGLGGLGVSMMLASPIGAPKVARWARIAEAAKRLPSPERRAAFYGATADLANTARALGVNRDMGK